jgi:hypothetical protein
MVNVGATPNSPSTFTAEDAGPEGMQLSPPAVEQPATERARRDRVRADAMRNMVGL